MNFPVYVLIEKLEAWLKADNLCLKRKTWEEIPKYRVFLGYENGPNMKLDLSCLKSPQHRSSQVDWVNTILIRLRQLQIEISAFEEKLRQENYAQKRVKKARCIKFPILVLVF
jgi:hypothetical protein